MRQENSAGVLIFYFDKEPKFLILKYPTYWGFAKGWIEKDETEKQAAIREAKEEAGLSVSLISGFKEQQKWFYKSHKDKKTISKKCIYFLAEISRQKAKKTKISKEHNNFKFISLKDSKKYIKIKQNKELLKKAHDFIKKYKQQRRLF
jgi:8-oxo-dGTP pyrophosphatase MutT (NUDIX family)